MRHLILFLLLTFAISCQKSNLIIGVKSEVNYCCNLWGTTTTASDTPQTLPDFLEENNIEFSNMEIINNGPQVICAFCCNCPAGKTVEFMVSEDDLQAVIDLGFERK